MRRHESVLLITKSNSVILLYVRKKELLDVNSIPRNSVYQEVMENKDSQW